MFVAEEPGPLERVARFRRAMAGAETNVATGLARLGHRAGWIGRVGDDPFGRFALAAARRRRRRHHRRHARLRRPHRLPAQEPGRRWGPGGRLLPAQLGRQPAGALDPATDAYVAAARHLHVTGIPLALSASARDFAFRAVDVARAAGATVSFDPNLRPTLWASPQEMVRVVNEMAARADWVLPGLAEGHLLTGRPDADGVAAFYLEQGPPAS